MITFGNTLKRFTVARLTAHLTINREAHISFQKNTPDEEADVAAFFLLFFNDFPHRFELAMKQAGTTAYGYAEKALGTLKWGEPEKREEDFAESRLKYLDNVPKEIKARLQKAIERGVADRESALAISRRFDE